MDEMLQRIFPPATRARPLLTPRPTPVGSLPPRLEVAFVGRGYRPRRMPETTAAAPPKARFGETARVDAWWVEPALTALVLMAFVVYSTWAALQGKEFSYGNYLSPFYSPLLFGPDSWFGALPSWYPAWLPTSPALFILWAPGGFRFTCYYYRKAYYRSVVTHPLACAVSEGRTGYCGETRFPLLLQNLHRYFLYLAILFLFFLWSDVVKAFRFEVIRNAAPALARFGPGHEFGIGVGSLVLLACTSLLTLYTLSCHSLRHLAGGRLDCFSACPLGEARYKAWSLLSRLNEHHMFWAWTSLFGVGLGDLYIRLVAKGIIADFRIL